MFAPTRRVCCPLVAAVIISEGEEEDTDRYHSDRKEGTTRLTCPAGWDGVVRQLKVHSGAMAAVEGTRAGIVESVRRKDTSAASET